MQNAMFLYFFDDFGALWYKSFQKTSSPQLRLLVFLKLRGSIEDKFPCRYFWGRVKTKTRQYGSIAKNLLSRYSISSK